MGQLQWLDLMTARLGAGFMKAPLGRLGRAAHALIGKLRAEEVAAILRRLKEVMERGKIIDTSYYARGKFSNV
jgi:hypothetical protein